MTKPEDSPEPDNDEPEICPSCGEEIEESEPGPDIIQIIPALPGYRAVYAEIDEHDPTKMSVEDIACWALVRHPDGSTFVGGMTVYEDSMMPCWELGSFMGYVPPGKDPDRYATKVKKFLEDNKESGE